MHGRQVNPPSGGGMRTSGENWAMSAEAGGYIIPAGWVISADPRVNNFSDNIFPIPEQVFLWAPHRASSSSLGRSAIKGTPTNEKHIKYINPNIVYDNTVPLVNNITCPNNEGEGTMQGGYLLKISGGPAGRNSF